MKTFDMVVASHLRWSFVWQRPQQLLSRLAKYHRILFVEEPVFVAEGVDKPSALLEEALPNLFVLTPQVLASECGDTPLWLWPCREEIDLQVRQALQTLEFRHRALWLYTPTPDFLVDTVRPEMLVYDVMDELANFKFAPPQLKENEKRLLAQSAIVFTGGASMYEAKKHLNPNTHLFASGVDGKHYATACDPTTTTPEWMESIPSPRATYIGVIDERLDYDLIAQMAAAYPDVQFLMCGPVVKVDPAHLPQRPNLHYPGQQTYADLPRILKGSDICLMPFAQNDATRYISPTKTLEYMATHRPIVSTSIPDVVRFYSDIVYLADTAEQFLPQIAAALAEPAHERARKHRREEKILAEQAWDAIADSMETLMQAEWSKTPTGKTQRTAERPAVLLSSPGKSAPVRQATERSVTSGSAANATGLGGE
ncbi:MAG: UDP-galactopyranose mutase [Chthonomonadales bacterium]|nr:UDP-galactopyranose mutase [Chthonomonadales bacterium]